MAPRLGIVVPCYNEEKMLSKTSEVLMGVLNGLIHKCKITDDSFICFVDDGSGDETWGHILRFRQASQHVKGLRLSRNFGHQNAILAGMLFLKEKVDCVLTIDADLQDDVNVIENFIDHYRQGYEIVYGVRKERSSDSVFKRYTALIFYRILIVLGVNIIYNHADYRLVGKRALAALADYREINLFLRGIFPDLGFKSISVEYDRQKRIAGETKYSLPRMVALAINGITSFSIEPLRFITTMGITVFMGTLFLSVWVFLTVVGGRAIPGWASTVLPLYFLGGVQTIFLGIIGEYIGKIYSETKMRPRFIINEVIE